LAAAREVDDCDIHSLRRLFLDIELECDGTLTQSALENAASLPGAVGDVAVELVRVFETLDVDGSGTIDWTEFAAAAFCASDGGQATKDTSSPLGPSALAPQRTSDADGAIEQANRLSHTPALSDDLCWHAFDLLSQGTDTISGATLAQLLIPAEASTLVTQCSGGPSGGTGGSFDANGAVGALKCPRLADLQRIVREADANGIVTKASFLGLLQKC